MKHYHTQGFSLIELMVVVVIMAILVIIAIPSYQNYLIDSRRAEAQNALMDAAARVERAAYENIDYDGITLSDIGMPVNTENNLYALSLASTASGYTLTATPQGAQADDTECTTLTYNHLGQKGGTGSATDPARDCW